MVKCSYETSVEGVPQGGPLRSCFEFIVRWFGMSFWGIFASVMRKIAGYLTKNRSEKDQKIAQSTHENGYIKPRKTFWRNSKQLLSLLFANIMLNELDKELFRRGHKFVRYADDCLILCRSKRAVARVRESIFTYIESRQDRGGLCRQGKVFRLLFLQVYLWMASSPDTQLCMEELEEVSNCIRTKELPYAGRWCERSENESRKKTASFPSYSIIYKFLWMW